ncbi:hypothetical protein CR513_09494, partial [Mucuna pruriens]
MVIYLDDRLVSSMCVDDHVKHNKSLYVNLEKYTFYTQEVVFLGFVVESEVLYLALANMSSGDDALIGCDIEARLNLEWFKPKPSILFQIWPN